MSWSASTKARRFAADGEITQLFRGVKKQLDNPVAQRVVKVHEDAVKEFLANTPIDGDVSVNTWGHFNNDGTGEATLSLKLDPHVWPAEPVVVAAEEAPPEVVPE